MDTRQQGDEDLYRICVGEEKVGYYLPLFERFDSPGASRVSWNWPAFFITFFWLLYRRMYGLAFVYFLALPIVMVIFGGVMMWLLGQTIGAMIYAVVAIAVPWIIVPMFANALYHRHVRSRVAIVSVGAPSRAAVVQRLIGQGATTNGAVIVGVACFGGVALIGILAAIAIPAYQDYVIRSQVTEGLALAAPVRAAVTQVYAETGEWPADLDAAHVTPEAGKYVESVDVTDGVISIRYGGIAHGAIAGSSLSLHPSATDSGEVTWSCGYAAPSRAGTTISPKHVPSSCRAPR